MSRPGRSPRVRPATVAPVLGLVVAFGAQSERLPLVAAVGVAIFVSTVAGLSISKRALSFQLRYPSGSPWYVGDTVTLRTVVGNVGPRSISVLTVVQDSPGLQLDPFVVPELGAGESAAVAQQVVLSRRSGPQPVVYTATFHDRLMGAESAARATSRGGTQALPAVRPRPDLPPTRWVDLMSRPAQEGRGSGRRGSGDPLSLRPFASGDHVSSVHWRSTARAGTPIVMEREQLQSGVLVLLVGSSGDGVEWEAAVARAAGLVEAAAAASVPIELLAAPPAAALPGSPTPDAVQDWLAALQVSAEVDPRMVGLAVRAATGGLLAVLSGRPELAAAAVATGAARPAVVDLLASPW